MANRRPAAPTFGEEPENDESGIWRGLRDDLRNFLLSERSYVMKAFAVKFEELRLHTNLPADFMTP